MRESDNSLLHPATILLRRDFCIQDSRKLLLARVLQSPTEFNHAKSNDRSGG